MISWQTQLNPKQMNQVASYVLTFQGTKPAAPKAPEGTVWVDSTATNKDYGNNQTGHTKEIDFSSENLDTCCALKG